MFPVAVTWASMSFLATLKFPQEFLQRRLQLPDPLVITHRITLELWCGVCEVLGERNPSKAYDEIPDLTGLDSIGIHLHTCLGDTFFFFNKTKENYRGWF